MGHSSDGCSEKSCTFRLWWLGHRRRRRRRRRRGSIWLNWGDDDRSKKAEVTDLVFDSSPTEFHDGETPKSSNSDVTSETARLSLLLILCRANSFCSGHLNFQSRKKKTPNRQRRQALKPRRQCYTPSVIPCPPAPFNEIRPCLPFDPQQPTFPLLRLPFFILRSLTGFLLFLFCIFSTTSNNGTLLKAEKSTAQVSPGWSCGSGLPFEVMFLQDTSWSIADDIPNIRRVVPEFVEVMTSKYPGTRISFAAFSDIAMPDLGWHAWHPIDVCFELLVPFTEEKAGFAKALLEIRVRSGRDPKESQLVALQHAARGGFFSPRPSDDMATHQNSSPDCEYSDGDLPNTTGCVQREQQPNYSTASPYSTTAVAISTSWVKHHPASKQKLSSPPSANRQTTPTPSSPDAPPPENKNSEIAAATVAATFRRIIVMSTDSPYHEAGDAFEMAERHSKFRRDPVKSWYMPDWDYKVYPNNGDGQLACEGKVIEDYPSVSQVAAALKDVEAVAIFFVSASVKMEYQRLRGRLASEGFYECVVVEVSDDYSDLHQTGLEALEEAICPTTTTTTMTTHSTTSPPSTETAERAFRRPSASSRRRSNRGVIIGAAAGVTGAAAAAAAVAAGVYAANTGALLGGSAGASGGGVGQGPPVDAFHAADCASHTIEPRTVFQPVELDGL